MSIDDDRRIIRELVENWALWCDARLWDRFRTVWHADGRMMATWFQGSFEEFISANDQGWARGVRILHFLGGSAIDVSGSRAIAQTKMTISQRAPVDGVVCDVVCTSPLATRDPALLERARAEGRLWDIDTGHDLMITEPEKVTRALVQVAGA